MSIGRRPIAAVWAVVVVASQGSCWFPRGRQLPGTYLTEGDWGKATLLLRPDGTLEESVALRGGARARLSGHWKVDGSGSGIDRDPCFKHDEDKMSLEMYFCDNPTQVVLGHVEIVLDPNLGFVYSKQ
jgi:hypothetical protein